MPGAAAPSPIADKLRIPNALPSNIPAGHVAVTFPIRSEDADMIDAHQCDGTGRADTQVGHV